MTQRPNPASSDDQRLAAEAIERPVPNPGNGPKFGSDVVAETLLALDIPYIALNPGASYRGFHDSLERISGHLNRGYSLEGRDVIQDPGWWGGQPAWVKPFPLT